MVGPPELTPDEAKLFVGQPKGFPLGGFDLEDVMLPEGDDMGIPSDDGDGSEEEVAPESGFGSVIGECEGGREKEVLHAPVCAVSCLHSLPHCARVNAAPLDGGVGRRDRECGRGPHDSTLGRRWACAHRFSLPLPLPSRRQPAPSPAREV